MFQTYMPFTGIELNALTLVAIGFAVGVLAAFFGMGGGWIVTPTLNILGFPVAHAIGTELANITCQSGIAAVKHRKMGNVEYGLGLCVGGFMAGGVEGGKGIVKHLTAMGMADEVVRWIYVAFLAGLGTYMLQDLARARRRAASESAAGVAGRGGRPSVASRLRLAPMIRLRSAGTEVSAWVLAALGLFVGLLAGVMGCGGGFALVPLFVYVVGVRTRVAVGTSLLCVMVSGAYGAFTYGMDGHVELIAVLWLTLGSMVGTQFGGAAIRYVAGAGIRLLYAVMLLLAAVGVLMKQFGLSGPALAVTLGGALVMCFVIIGSMVLSVRARRRAEQRPADGGGRG